MLPPAVRLIVGPDSCDEVVRGDRQSAFVDHLLALLRQPAAEHQPTAARSACRLIEQLREREAEVAALSAARGAEQERTRISREMHDTLAQGFTSIVTLGHAVRGELDT